MSIRPPKLEDHDDAQRPELPVVPPPAASSGNLNVTPPSSSNPELSVGEIKGPPNSRRGEYGQIARALGGAAIGAAVVLMPTDHHATNAPISVAPKTPIRRSQGADPPEPTQDAGPPTEPDPCDRANFETDATPAEFAKPGEPICKFEADGNKTQITGHPILDKDGLPRSCFLTPIEIPNAAAKIRGKFEVFMSAPGKLNLVNGKICLISLADGKNPDATEINVLAEASVHVVTSGKVIVKFLEPDKTDKASQNYILVIPVDGETLVTQDGRMDPYGKLDQKIIKKGDPGLRIPLKLEHPDNRGCQIATTNSEGDFTTNNTGTYLLTAGAIFMVLRRKKQGKAKKTP